MFMCLVMNFNIFSGFKYENWKHKKLNNEL